jgi:hypothetical protein
VLRVVHAPSNPGLKGTAIIERSISELQSQGLRFEYQRIEGIPHEEMPKVLSEADILVDELILHGPGWLSLEAMASGCVVATRFLEESPACFRPPVVPIDQTTVRERLGELIQDPARRRHLIEMGLKYVAGNDVGLVSRKILEKTCSAQEFAPDYVPGFLQSAYWTTDERIRLGLPPSLAKVQTC